MVVDKLEVSITAAIQKLTDTGMKLNEFFSVLRLATLRARPAWGDQCLLFRCTVIFGCLAGGAILPGVSSHLFSPGSGSLAATEWEESRRFSGKRMWKRTLDNFGSKT